ncbi:MAG: hypothetical protein ABI867_05785 [Kofleriaceae bacterium]
MKWGVLIALVAACGDDHREVEKPPEAPPPRRVIEPPSGQVRPLPPYAITATEVGPYKLRQKITTLLDKLPSGPRIARFEIPGLLHTSVIRAEDDTVLIGGEPGSSLPSSSTTFVAVVGSEVARTETGVHVGLARKELKGPVVDDLEHARDPRLVVPAALRNARILVDDERVLAIVLVAEPPMPPGLSTDPVCARPAPSEGKLGACLTGVGEHIEIDGDDIVVRSAETEKVITTIRVPGLVFAAPLRNPTEGRDELVAIARTDDPAQRTWSVVAFRFDAGKRTMAVDPTPLYQLTNAQTRWIGADLKDVDLYVELASRSDGIEVGGLLTTRQRDRIRDVVVISPVTITRRHGKSATAEGGDAGVSVGAPAGPDADPLDAPSSGAGR